jgi:pyochelin biosynthesis protein PchC
MRSDPAAEIVFCLPHAGGGRHNYLMLGQGLGRTVAWEPIDYPGHFTRADEAPYATFADAVDGVGAVVAERGRGRRVGLFGHSLGGSLAFEIGRRLPQRGGAAPTAIVVSSAAAPGDPEVTGRRLFDLDDEHLLDHLGELGHASTTDPRRRELLRAALPLLRADLRLHHSYRDYAGRAGPGRSRGPAPGSLDVPLHVCCGASEPVAGRIDRWRRHGTRGVTVHRFPGGHFYWQEDPAGLTALLADVFAGRPADHPAPRATADPGDAACRS